MTYRYKTSLVGFIAVLGAFMVIQAAMIIGNQRAMLREQAEGHTSHELQLVGWAAMEMLLKHDYASVQSFVTGWAEGQEYVVSMRATAPNGFVLVDYRRETPALGGITFESAYDVEFEGMRLLGLQIVGDYVAVERALEGLYKRLIAFSAIFVGALGIALWYSQRELAIKPLRDEIARRMLVEAELERERAGLEDKVRERTGELIMELDERRKAEEALRQSEQRLFMHIQNTPLGVIEWDMDFRVVEWNPGAQRIFGYPRDEALGRDAMELIVPPSAKRKVSGIWVGMLASRSVTPSTNENVTRDGRAITCEWYNTPLTDKDDRVIGVASLVLDITDRVKAYEELRRLNEELETRVRQRTSELEAANLELESFSYSVSHDLRSPLRAIDGFSQALLEDYSGGLDEQGLGYLNRVRAASVRMARLIDDMLKLSRVTRAELRMIELDLSAMATDVVHELREADPGRTVIVAIRETPPATGDPALMRIALANLIGNSWKYTKGQAQAFIEFGSMPPDEAGRTVFFVKDDGVGFDMTYADKLFGAFQRLHAEKEFEGTGIGLATVARVIARHGGRAWAQGEPGKGATFYFTLG